MNKKQYLSSLLKQFQYYKMLGDKTIQALSEAETKIEIAEGSNSIAIIVRHLAGNMKSRFTDFLNSDGEKEWRQRDQEFEYQYSSMAEMLADWNEGWDKVFEAIHGVEDLETLVYIRNQGHTVYEALNRQLAHYAYHIGQMVFIGKCIKGRAWKSLSIPKGESSKFNEKKFNDEPQRGHYTDEFLEESS